MTRTGGWQDSGLEDGDSVSAVENSLGWTEAYC